METYQKLFYFEKMLNYQPEPNSPDQIVSAC